MFHEQRIKKISKNERAAKICGIRSPGVHANNIFEPWELDYVCPLCHTTPYIKRRGPRKLSEVKINSETLLEFSEYNGFLWCPKCNIDIPSYFCKTGLNKENIEENIANYLEMIEGFVQHAASFAGNAEKAEKGELLARIADLKKEVKYYKEESRVFGLDKIFDDSRKMAEKALDQHFEMEKKFQEIYPGSEDFTSRTAEQNDRFTSFMRDILQERLLGDI